MHAKKSIIHVFQYLLLTVISDIEFKTKEYPKYSTAAVNLSRSRSGIFAAAWHTSLNASKPTLFSGSLGFARSRRQKEKKTPMRLFLSWLGVLKKISSDFLKKPLVIRLFRAFFINPYCLTRRGVMLFPFWCEPKKISDNSSIN